MPDDDVEDIFASFADLQGEREIIHTPGLVRFGPVAVTAAPKGPFEIGPLPQAELTAKLSPSRFAAGEAIHMMADQLFSSGVVRLTATSCAIPAG